MANKDPECDLGLHCLHMPFCQKLWKKVGLIKAGLNIGVVLISSDRNREILL